MSGDYFGSIGELEAARAQRRASVQKWGRETLEEADRVLAGGVYAEDWDFDDDELEEVVFEEVEEPEEAQEPVIVSSDVAKDELDGGDQKDESPVIETVKEVVVTEKPVKAPSKRGATSK